jgi:hypothetical protein
VHVIERGVGADDVLQVLDDVQQALLHTRACLLCACSCSILSCSPDSRCAWACGMWACGSEKALVLCSPLSSPDVMNLVVLSSCDELGRAGVSARQEQGLV